MIGDGSGQAAHACGDGGTTISCSLVPNPRCVIGRGCPVRGADGACGSACEAPTSQAPTSLASSSQALTSHAPTPQAPTSQASTSLRRGRRRHQLGDTGAESSRRHWGAICAVIAIDLADVDVKSLPRVEVNVLWAPSRIVVGGTAAPPSRAHWCRIPAWPLRASSSWREKSCLLARQLMVERTAAPPVRRHWCRILACTLRASSKWRTAVLSNTTGASLRRQTATTVRPLRLLWLRHDLTSQI
jgi:hypothetical protein